MNFSDLYIRKLTVIICMLFITSFVLTPSAPEYEVSIFEGFSAITLGLGLLVVITSVSLIVTSIIYGKRYWWIAAIAIVVAYIGFYFAPLVRGYVLYTSLGTDQLSHLGMIDDILKTGYIPDDRYPATHILFSELALLTDLPLEALARFIPFWFFLVYLYSSIQLTWSLTSNKMITLCVMLTLLPILFGVHRLVIMPWLFALSIVPLLLFCVHKLSDKRGRQWFFIVLVLYASLVVYHPISMFYALVVCFGYWITLQLLRQQISPVNSQLAWTILYGGILFVSWIVIAARAEQHLAGVIIRLTGYEPGSVAQATEAAESGFTIGQIFWYFILPDLGILIIFLMLSGFAFFIIAYQQFYVRNQTTFETLINVQFFIGTIFAVLFMIIKIYGTAYVRIAQLMILFSPFVLGAGIHRITHSLTISARWKRIILSLVLIILFTGLVIGGGLTAYENNRHLTESTTEGYGWLLENKELTKPIYADTGRDRFAWYYIGYSDAERLRTQGYISSHYDLPDRLGYERNSQIDESINNGYLVTTTADMKRYEAEPEWRLKSIDHYEQSDIDQISSDRHAIRVYSSQNYTVWYINS